ncbi:unnamed protein product [Neospora caninum Liverpool]|uniref:Rhoptry protein, putative n=1 Tax=Neospora caninum (strain Liverpool) TaxID=572307 RepID=F0VNY7_NEOCL|nr:uncharacterized protein NCLIV_058560 [Neospora caninum Liverpool]CBZ55433.1 unnamed protein product [Neospora caninum Liverpool]CEL70169.1 TPA: rhoptry protein, putative [Neospora caninum Liverpool]|eukprot:XP_003885461.1 uncharacterized protein NCLIV_058560 [Neospora caninum Liverpool]
MGNGAEADPVGDSGPTPEAPRSARAPLSRRIKESWKRSCSRSRSDLKLTADDLSVMEGTYWLTRIVFFRALGLVYFVAFLIAHIQGPGLFGQDGLLPLEKTSPCTGGGRDTRGFWTRFAASPSLFHFLSCSDASLLFVTSSGLVLSAVLALAGGATVPVFLWLWLSYLTIQEAGQRFYTFTWDTLLLEVGFWAMPLSLVCFFSSVTPLKKALSPTTASEPSARSSLSASPSLQSPAAGALDSVHLDSCRLRKAENEARTGSAELSSTDATADQTRAGSDTSPSAKRSVAPRVQQMLRWPCVSFHFLRCCFHCLVSPRAPFLPPAWPTPWISVWGYRWLLFRLMLGAGLIKLRADTAWTDLTAMQWHYETQPLPNPVAWFAHAAPMSVHKFEVLMNHFVELILPFAVLAPWRQLRLFTGCFQLVFQVAIIITGNLAFINWLTIVFIVFLFDDRFLMRFFPTSTLNRLQPLLQGCAGRWAIPRSDAAINELSTGDSRTDCHPRSETEALSERNQSQVGGGGPPPVGNAPESMAASSETGGAQVHPPPAGNRKAAVSPALPWRLLRGPKWKGRTLRRMLAMWGCWRIPLFLLISASLVASDGVLLLLLGKASAPASFTSTLAWESAGLVLLALISFLSLGALTGARVIPWSFRGAGMSLSLRFPKKERPVSDLASVESRGSLRLDASPQDADGAGAFLRRPRQAEGGDLSRRGGEDGVTERKKRLESPVDADEGDDEAKLLWKRTQDVGALILEVVVAGVVLSNLLFMHFHLGPTFASLDVLTGMLCVLLFFFARRHCSNSFLVLRVMTEVGMLVVLAWHSVPVVENLLSPNQIMNDTYHPFCLVNSYGLFGLMTKQREELIIQGTYERNPPSAPSSPVWKTYEFYCKPGDIDRRPCAVSPYYYRLDWLMWFAAFNPDVRAPYWLFRLVAKLLVNDSKTSALLAYNPFRGKRPPRFIRILRYDYHFAYKGKEKSLYEQGRWWQRKYLSEFLPPVSAELFHSN